MDLPEGALCEVLLLDQDLTNLIGDRLYSHPAPKEAAYPLISYQRISTIPRRNLDGRSDLSGVRIQLSVYAQTSTECATVSETAQDAADNYQGIANSLDIKDISVDDSESGGGVLYDEALGIYESVFDVIVTYRRERDV